MNQPTPSPWRPIASAPPAASPDDVQPVLIAKYGCEPFVAVNIDGWGWVATVYFADNYAEFRSDLDEELARSEHGFEPDVWMPLEPVPVAHQEAA
jgi:hypothetical protein